MGDSVFMSVNSPRIQSLDRALDLLEEVARSEDGVSLATLSERVGISSPATYQLAQTLVARGYLEKNKRPVRYQVGRMVFELAQSDQRQGVLRSALRELRRLRGRFPEATFLVVESMGGNLVTRLRAGAECPGWISHPDQPVNNPYAMATAICCQAFMDPDDLAMIRMRFPFDEFAPRESGTFRQFLKRLNEAREGGRVIVKKQRFLVAAPIYSSGGSFWGAVGGSFSEFEETGEDRQLQLTDAVVEAASSISRRKAPSTNLKPKVE